MNEAFVFSSWYLFFNVMNEALPDLMLKVQTHNRSLCPTE
jgi:hypothetical protein